MKKQLFYVKMGQMSPRYRIVMCGEMPVLDEKEQDLQIKPTRIFTTLAFLLVNTV